MCKTCGESIDRLFLNCEFATEMWIVLFSFLVLRGLCLGG